MLMDVQNDKARQKFLIVPRVESELLHLDNVTRRTNLRNELTKNMLLTVFINNILVSIFIMYSIY